MFRWRPTKVNRLVLTFVYADFMFFTAAGFLTPIIAVFYVEQIRGGSLAVVGFATMVFWVVKSAVQVPVSLYADNHKGEFDDFFLLIAGEIIAAGVPLLYFFLAREVWQIYLFEAIRGVGYALLTPTYLAIFTRHIDKYRENTEWTLHSNAVGLGYAAAAALGGALADRFGFRIVFIIVSIGTLISPILLMTARKDLQADDGRGTPGPAAQFAREKRIIQQH